jgi:hypothetical protein
LQYKPKFVQEANLKGFIVEKTYQGLDLRLLVPVFCKEAGKNRCQRVGIVSKPLEIIKEGGTLTTFFQIPLSLGAEQVFFTLTYPGALRLLKYIPVPATIPIHTEPLQMKFDNSIAVNNENAIRPLFHIPRRTLCRIKQYNPLRQ